MKVIPRTHRGNSSISSINKFLLRITPFCFLNAYSVCVGKEFGTKRRELLFQAVSSVIAFPALTSVALADNEVMEDFRVYTDEANKFKITIPQDWLVGTGEGDGVRSLIAFYPQNTANSSVSLAITSLGADFTRLESFGKVDAFAENLACLPICNFSHFSLKQSYSRMPSLSPITVNKFGFFWHQFLLVFIILVLFSTHFVLQIGGLDRSWQRPPGVAAKLIDCKAANGLYYIEYTLQNPGESRRHLFSVLGMANNGFYNRLYTLTGQFVDEEAEKFGAKIEKAVASFRLIV
ncbi:psbP domain-containing 3, chloroplastic [Olea europaea subsp. europaea]|uniref:PsbP domain-containing 3, chloroplastic n=1 Tax=Olea europaea subsp. europaea TaxID=158383 RepID=A0A8S0SA52_OLEEU|nr:psbP domain-containing 3, chloroplastic [Olea europaea subsp. europaea]